MANTNKKLKEITGNYKDDFKRICDLSREKRLKELKPGERIPEKGFIYGDEAKDQFRTKAEQYRNKAIDLIDAEINVYRDKLTDAPSTEALNSVQLMALREKVTKDDINDLIERYGDNPMVFDTIKDLAKQKGIISESEFIDHPLRQKIDAMENVRKHINRSLTFYEAERGHATDGFIAFLDSEIDGAFDPEE